MPEIDFAYHFKQGIKRNLDFVEALTIVQANSRGGNIWVIGGSVYRSIVESLYGVSNLKTYDFDFLVENPAHDKELVLPAGWKAITTGLGEPRFVKDTKQIDFVDVNHAVHPDERGKVDLMNSQQKIESYFRRAPLKLQAIAFDTEAEQIIGNIGKEAIQQKVVEVHSIDECLSFCKRRRISVREFVATKAKSLGFEARFPTFSLDSAKWETRDSYDAYFKE